MANNTSKKPMRTTKGISIASVPEHIRKLNPHLWGKVEVSGAVDPQGFQVKKSMDEAKLNKTETRWLSELQGMECDWIGVQNVTLKLGDNCRYTPDFVSLRKGVLTVWEVKGFWRDDARVKIKVAARQFAWLKFVAVSYKKGAWQIEEISA